MTARDRGLARHDDASLSVVPTNEARLVTLRVAGEVLAPALNVVVDPDGRIQGRPGQGGVILRPRLGDAAVGWWSDHVEPGVTIGHTDPAADEALQQFSCVGNRATMLDGAAAGEAGVVFGKHGGVLVSFAAEVLGRVAPGDRVLVEARGVGLAADDEPAVTFHSCDPGVAARLLRRAADGRLKVRVRAVMPREAAGAGIGMRAARYNLDLQVAEGEAALLAADLRLGDIVAVRDQDHRYLRVPRPGWLAIGVIAHGQSAGGGHGLGLVTLLTAPEDRLAIEVAGDATFRSLVDLTRGTA